MKTARKKILSLALAVLLVLTGIGPMSVQAATVEGDGYSFDTETGALTVSTNAGTTAWRNDSNIGASEEERLLKIKSVVLEEGITKLGVFPERPFENCVNLKSVDFPSSLLSISNMAFESCDSLKNVDLSNCTNLTTIGYEAFGYCDQLESVSFPASLQSITDSAFIRCNALTTLRFFGATPPTVAINVFDDSVDSNGKLYYPAEGVVGGTKYNAAYFGSLFDTWTFTAFDADAATGLTAITPASGYGGEITNDSLTCTVTPTETGYVIDEVLIDGVAQTVTNRTEFTYTFADDGKSHSIFATFAYTVNFNSPANGSLTVASAGNLTSGTIVRGGQALVITAEPESGYVLQSLTVNGTNVTSSYSGGYTYTVGTLDTTRTRMVGSNKVANQGADIVAVFALSGGGTGTAPTITPMTLPGGTVDTAYSATLTATGDTPITWSVVSGALPDGLNLSSDGKLSGTPTADGTFTFTVTATNNAGSALMPFSIAISAAAATVDSVTVSPSEIEVEKGTTQQFGATVTGTNNPANTVTWSLHGYSGSSTINSSGLLTVDAGETESELTVRATSTVDDSKYGEATVTITDSAPAPVYSISLGISGTHSFPAATESYGAQAPLSVTVTNTGNQATGELSVELSGTDEGSFAVAPETISSIATASDATFTVTPETGISAGTHTATVTVSGDNGISETFEVSFTVNPAAPSGTAPTITTTTLPGGTVGTAYSQTLTATGDAPISWSIDSGDLPDGLDISGNIISGTPTADGTFTFTVKAENDEGDDTKQLSITIAPATAPEDVNLDPYIFRCAERCVLQKIRYYHNHPQSFLSERPETENRQSPLIPGWRQGGLYLRKCFSYPNTGGETCRFPCSLLFRLSCCLIGPDFFCNLLDERQLAPLVLIGDKIAFLGGSKAALRAERQLLERHIPGSLADTRDNVFLLFQPGILGGYQTQNDLLLADVAQRLETACTVAVVLEEEAVHVEGIKLLAMDWYFGERDIISKKPINSPDDMKGLKIRVPSNTMWTATMEALGAAPTTIQWSEVYSALDQGVVDAAEAPLATIYSSKLQEAAKYISTTGHFTGIIGLQMSQKVWDSMTEEQQTALTECIEEEGKIYSENVLGSEQEYREKLEAEGVTFIDVDRAPFQELCQSVYTKFPEWSDGLLETVQAAMQ